MRRTRRESIKPVIAFLTMAILAAAFFVWLLTLGGGLPTLSGTHYQLSAVVPNAGAQLVPGARVTMAGVQVGRVDSVSRRGADAIVAMTIDRSGVTPLPSDSRAQVRTRTPLGENYMEIFVGRSRSKLASGAVIGVRQAAATVDVDQVLSVLSGRDRIQTRRLIQGLGGAVDGRGAELNELVGSGASTVTNGSQVVDAVAGERTQISQLVAQLGDLTAGVGAQGSDIRELAQAGVTTFDAVAARDAELRRLIDVLPSTLDAVKTATAKLQGVTGQAAPVLFNLASTLVAARPAAQLLAPASEQLHRVVSDLGAAAPPLRQTLGQLRTLSPHARVVLPKVRELLCQINPMIRYVKPYTHDILALFTEFGAAANSYDTIGHTMLLDPSINEDADVGQTPAMAAAMQTLLEAGLLSKTSHLTYVPFPAPDQANAVATSSTTEVTGPATVKAQTGYTYPHIEADC